MPQARSGPWRSKKRAQICIAGRSLKRADRDGTFGIQLPEIRLATAIALRKD
jgi:hypothetical protein